MKNIQNSALFRLHIVVFLWGFTAIIGKLITVESTVLVFYRMFLTAIILLIYTRFYKKQRIKVSKKMFLKLIGTGIIMAIHWMCFFQSIKDSNVSIALCCLSLSTLFAALLEPLIYRRKIDFSEVIIGVIIVACISLIFNVEIDYKTGILFGILAALTGTLFSIFNGKIYGTTSSENIIIYEMIGGFSVLFLYFLGVEDLSSLTQIENNDFIWIILLATVFTAFPMLESVKAMKYISPFTLILTINLEPIYGIIFAFFIFGESEKMSPIFYGASLVMILSIIINGILKNHRKNKPLNY